MVCLIDVHKKNTVLLKYLQRIRVPLKNFFKPAKKKNLHVNHNSSYSTWRGGGGPTHSVRICFDLLIYI